MAAAAAIAQRAASVDDSGYEVPSNDNSSGYEVPSSDSGYEVPTPSKAVAAPALTRPSVATTTAADDGYETPAAVADSYETPTVATNDGYEMPDSASVSTSISSTLVR